MYVRANPHEKRNVIRPYGDILRTVDVQQETEDVPREEDEEENEKEDVPREEDEEEDEEENVAEACLESLVSGGAPRWLPR